MKKLLTILVLALALCLVCGSALAAEYLGSFTEPAALAAALEAAADDYGLDAAGRTYNPTVATLIAGDHGVRTKVDMTGTKGGKTVTTEVFVTVGHTWKKDTAKSIEPTCTEAGTYVYGCTKAGCTGSKTESVPALGHTFVEVCTATCGADGFAYNECTRCGFIEKDALGNEIKVPVAAGKDADGNAVNHTLVKDGKNKYKVVAPACGYPDGQFWGDADWEEGGYYKICWVCGKPLTNAGVEAEVDAVITNWASLADYTTNCKTLTDIDPISGWDGHNWETEPYKTAAATCYGPATYTVWCKVCGLMETKNVKDSVALDPVWILDPAVTCDTLYHGIAANFICKNCGKDATPAHAAQAAAVAYISMSDVDPAWLWYEPYGYVLTATIDGVDYAAEVYHDYNYIAGGYYANGNYYDTWEKLLESDDKAAICANGEQEYAVKCTKCGLNFWNNKSIANHKWTEWKAAVAKDEHGTETTRWESECEYCGLLRIKPFSDKPVDPCPADKHVWEPVDPTKVKCENLNAGTKLICSVCGEKKTDEWPLKHVWVDVSVIEQPTCKAAGSKIQKCSNPGCDVKLQIVEIPVTTDHKLAPLAGKAATCKDTGLEAAYKCSVCDKIFADAEGKTELATQKVIPADEKLHVPSELVAEVKPTCTEEGKKVYTCTVCGKTITEKVDKLEHVYGEWVLTTPATKDADGEETRTCTLCKEAKETRPVKYVVTKPAEYTLTASYDGATVTGKLAHVDDTLEADVKNIRVTFYIEGNYYMATMAEVAADGSFSVDGVGPIVYITVAATGNTSVNPEAYQKIAEPIEIIVK